MKVKQQRRISLICVIILILTTVVPNLTLFGSEVSADTATVTYNGTASYGASTVGNFTVNGEQAFCMEHAKVTPPGGTAVTSSVYNDVNIAKCLYYGYAGDGQWSGFTSSDMGIVITSLALDYFYNGNTHSIANEFINYVNSQSLPKKYLKFSNSNLTAFTEGNIQRTEDIILEGDSQYSITFTLQDGVTLHNVTQGMTSTGTVTVNGGDKIYFSTPLDSNISGTWVSENINGSAYKYSAIVWYSSIETYQILTQKRRIYS